MITIEINSDTPLTDPRFDILHAAARDIAEATGQMVRIVSNVTVAPPEKYTPATVADSQIPKPHKWPDLNDWRPRKGRDDGWFEHDGCTQPYADSALVDVMTETGNIITGRLAMNLAWNWSDPCVHRITWYRPHRPESHCTTSSLLKDQVDVKN